MWILFSCLDDVWKGKIECMLQDLNEDGMGKEEYKLFILVFVVREGTGIFEGWMGFFPGPMSVECYRGYAAITRERWSACIFNISPFYTLNGWGSFCLKPTIFHASSYVHFNSA